MPTNIENKSAPFFFAPLSLLFFLQNASTYKFSHGADSITEIRPTMTHLLDLI
jgi:hypothetical protein